MSPHLEPVAKAPEGVVFLYRQHLFFHALRSRNAAQAVDGKRAAALPAGDAATELGRQEPDTWLPPLLRNYLTWIGFAVPFVIYGINGLHRTLTFFPFAQLNAYVRFLRDSIGLNLRPRFEVIGLSSC